MEETQMNVRDVVKTAQRFATNNSPAILTAIGVTGTLSTAYLTGKATFKACEVLRIERIDRDNEQLKDVPAGMASQVPYPAITGMDAVKVVWKLYIPAATTAFMTCVAIVMATRLESRRAAAYATAYTLSEKAYSEYKDKVVEQIGKAKEQKVRDEVAQDKVRENPPSNNQVIITGKGEVLCYDAFTGRYFMADMESLRKAENDINRQILHSDYATVTDFYNLIGLAPTAVSDELGWNTDKGLELSFSSVISEDGKPCLSFDFGHLPFPEPWRFC
jgi:hypothetical protein